MKKINKNWWKNIFDETYLITDARSVCDNRLTQKEVDLIEKLIKPKKEDNILDLCGGHGRHSLELAKRGYKNITVLDYSKYLTSLGENTSKDAGLIIKFIRRDARSTKLKSSDYMAIIIMANSFGYFLNDSDNIKILKEANRLLKNGGKLLLDLTDSNYIKKTLKPVSWHEANNDILVCRRRELNNNTIKAREIVISKNKGLIRDGYYCERLYNKKKIIFLLKKAGFKNITIKNNLSFHRNKNDYGFLTSRMFVTAVKH